MFCQESSGWKRTGCSGVPNSGSRRGSVAALEAPPPPGPGLPGPGPPGAEAAGPDLVCLAGLSVRRANVLTTAYSINDVKTNSRQIIIQMSIACSVHTVSIIPIWTTIIIRKTLGERRPLPSDPVIQNPGFLPDHPQNWISCFPAFPENFRKILP